ncbi:sugar kinase [Carboxydochorda subterranea]|uniref:Sugar kinase n=1 Tax=Carboxydichorda subterranea TaxID=3109565 RepID=A0ABZ1BUZ0_9FIRM|nr:sugar kinase [Limnochorda sp. L945t]WRP16594.1 sugar kinase [Limnochorda sp. L945t]
MPASDQPMLILSMGEPMVELFAEEPGPLHKASRFVRGFGGDTSNFAVAVARLGGRAAYLCRVGGDEFGHALRELWNREGVDISRVKVVPGGFTAVYFISWREDGTHEFTYFRQGSAASTLQPSDLSPEQFRNVRLFHVSGITQAISLSACDAAFRAMELARQAGAWISYDPNFRPRLWPPARARAVMLESIRQADVVTPNREEAALLTGTEDPEQAVSSLLALGPRIVALKLGPEGCLVGTRDGQRIRVSPPAVQTVDTGGAGDTFDAAFAIGLVGGWALTEVARFATAAGALTTAGKGCVAPIPTRAAVEAAMAGTTNDARRPPAAQSSGRDGKGE